MVDAIGASTNKPVKLVQDQSINWEQCTVDEIKEFQGQGQAVPTEILQWAEEIAKLESLPDDVTYEMTNGSTDIEQINQLLEMPEEDNAEGEEAQAAQANMSQAQAERASMEAGGTSLADQGRTFITRSSEASAATNNITSGLQGIVENANSIAAQAEAQAAQTQSETEGVKKEYDELLEKARTKQEDEIGLDAGEQARMAKLGQQLNTAGTRAQSALAGFNSQIAGLSASVSANTAIPASATDYGTQTTDIGLELMGKSEEERASIMGEASAAAGTNHRVGIFKREVGGALGSIKDNAHAQFRSLFNADYRVGMHATRAGAQAMDTGAQGTTQITQAVNDIEAASGIVNQAQNTVSNETYVQAQPSADNTDSGENNQEGNTEQAAAGTDNPEQAATAQGTTGQDDRDTQAQSAAAQEDVTLADPTITTDPDEILRRKERRGLA